MKCICVSRRRHTALWFPREIATRPSYGGFFAIGAWFGELSRYARELDHVVELAVLGAGQERGDLRLRVDERGTAGEPGIAYRDLAARQVRDLNARAVGVAVLALLPCDVCEPRGTHAAVWLDRVL